MNGNLLQKMYIRASTNGAHFAPIPSPYLTLAAWGIILRRVRIYKPARRSYSLASQVKQGSNQFSEHNKLKYGMVAYPKITEKRSILGTGMRDL